MLDKPNFSHAQRRESAAFGDELWRGGAEIILDVAFVNNMPDGAFEATERQFTRRLARGATPAKVRLHRFMFPEKKSRSALPDFDLERYESTEALRGVQMDALVVTGSEPTHPALRDEDYWLSLRGLVHWAQESTISAAWSCLAAHAAVLELDGVERKPLKVKCSGVYDCRIVSDHPIAGDYDACVAVPHSRWNELRERDLSACGYEILSLSPDAGVDLFLKNVNSLFLFLQGHPEYDARSLMLEYRRDLKRFVQGERPLPPDVPQNYFAADTQNLLDRIAAAATETRRFAAARTALRAEWKPKPAAWSSWSAALFENWLSYLATEKSRRLDGSPASAAQRPAHPSTSLRTKA